MNNNPRVYADIECEAQNTGVIYTPLQYTLKNNLNKKKVVSMCKKKYTTHTHTFFVSRGGACAIGTRKKFTTHTHLFVSRGGACAIGTRKKKKREHSRVARDSSSS